MFVVKNDDGKNDHKRYKYIYFNYLLMSYYRVRLFLAMQVRVMAACMESQSNIRSAQSRPRDGRSVSHVCGCDGFCTAIATFSRQLDSANRFYNIRISQRWDRLSVRSRFVVYLSRDTDNR